MSLRKMPRFAVAAVSSGSGKTTAVAALIGALRKRGLRVSSFKCGPDFLDPSYHERASERPCLNLDGWMMGKAAVLSEFQHGSRDADIAIIEGVMGLYDGFSPSSEAGSTAEIAKWLSAPVLLVADARGMSRSIAALVQGFAGFDPGLKLEGVIANFAGSRGHFSLLKSALLFPPVVGGFPREEKHAFPKRHLGLYRAASGSDPEIGFWIGLCEEWFDLDRILSVAQSAPPLETPDEPPDTRRTAGHKCRIGVAFDEAFHFYYDYNLRRLENEGAELVRFSPLHDPHLPEVNGLYIGGGYPEVYAQELSSNRALLEEIRQFAESGRPVYAECGGLMFLSESLITLDGTSFPMAGLVEGRAKMGSRRAALGYVEVAVEKDTVLGPAGLRFRGHQFRYSDFELRENSSAERVYRVHPRRGLESFPEGYHCRNVLASYIHAHWASNPLIAKNFTDSCAKAKICGAPA